MPKKNTGLKNARAIAENYLIIAAKKASIINKNLIPSLPQSNFKFFQKNPHPDYRFEKHL